MDITNEAVLEVLFKSGKDLYFELNKNEYKRVKEDLEMASESLLIELENKKTIFINLQEVLIISLMEQVKLNEC